MKCSNLFFYFCFSCSFSLPFAFLVHKLSKSLIFRTSRCVSFCFPRFLLSVHFCLSWFLTSLSSWLSMAFYLASLAALLLHTCFLNGLLPSLLLSLCFSFACALIHILIVLLFTFPQIWRWMSMLSLLVLMDLSSVMRLSKQSRESLWKAQVCRRTHQK